MVKTVIVNEKSEINQCDVVDKEVVKNTKFNTPKTKAINFEKKIPDPTTLIHINKTQISPIERKTCKC